MAFYTYLGHIEPISSQKFQKPKVEYQNEFQIGNSDIHSDIQLQHMAKFGLAAAISL